MVVGLVVGAIIALFCFILGCWAGARFAESNINSMKNNDVATFREEPIVETLNKTNHDEFERDGKSENNTVDLFRTSRGLLSYKKYVRSE
jgi:hypothetical protein